MAVVSFRDKSWSVIRLPKGKSKITCPHCGCVAVVSRAWYTRSADHLTRTCTYCGYTAFVPGKEPSGHSLLPF